MSASTTVMVLLAVAIVLFVRVSVLEIVGTLTPATVALPEPLGMRLILTSVSVPAAPMDGSPAAAALVISK